MKICLSLSASVALLALPVSAQAADIIDFDGLVGANGSAFTSYSEDGFTVTATGGQVFIGTVYGNPVPSLVVGPIFGGQFGSIDVALTGGGLFNFGGFDLIGSNGDALYTVEGFSGLSSVFSISGSQGISFATIGGSAGAIDRLSFALTATGSSLNIDNIIVTAAQAVPEPSTWALLLIGFGFVGGALRVKRRKQNVSVSYA